MKTTEREPANNGKKQDVPYTAQSTIVPATVEVGGDLCSIKDLIREINELENELKSVHKLTLNEAICLCCISKVFRSPTGCAEQMGLSPSRISRILNSLEKKGLIERQMKQDNHRSTELRLTNLGNERLENLRMSGFSFSRLDKGASTKNG